MIGAASVDAMVTEGHQPVEQADDSPPVGQPTGPPKPSFRAAFAERDFRLLVSGHAISAVGQSLSAVALVVLVFEVTGSPAWVAAASVARLLPYVFFSAAAGIIADRYERRSVMIASDLLRALLMGLLAAAVVFELHPLVAIVLAFCATAAGTPYFPAAAAMTPAIVGPRNLAAANSIMTTIESSAFIIGPGLGGILVALGTPAFAFGVNAFAFVASMLCVAGIASRGLPALAEVAAPLRQRAAAGFRVVSRSAGVAVLLGFVVVVNFIYGLAIVLLVFVADSPLQIGAEGYGFLNTALGAGAVLAALITNRLASEPRQSLVLSMGVLAAALPFALLGLIVSAPLAYGLMVVAGAGSIVVEVLALTLLQRALPHEVLARVVGIFDALAVGAILLGSSVAPALVALFGLELTLLGMGILLPLAAALGIPGLRRLEGEGAAKQARLAPRVTLLERSGLFVGAPQSALEAVARRLVPQTVDAGTDVLSEGDSPNDVYLIARGRFAVLSRGERGGEQRLVNELGTADYFGEIGLLEGIPRTATVRALDDAELLRLPGQDFLALLNAVPQVSGTLRDGIVSRLARTHPSYRSKVAGGAAAD